MMLTWIILGLFILASLSLIVLIVRKIPQLRLVDPATVAQEKNRQVKQDLILQRFSRFREQKLRGVSKVTGGAVKTASKLGRRAVQRLYAIEQYYQKLQKLSEENTEIDSTAIKKLLKEADALVKEEEYVLAEKKYIEIISHHPKQVEAYEQLGNLYVRAKRFDQARETLLFVLKLSPEDASVFMSLGELAAAQDDLEGALAWFRKATHKREKNPKYLHTYIEAALKLKVRKDAGRGIRLLERVNPENKKLEEFKKRFDELISPK